MHFIGLDAGSVTVKAVVLDASGNKLKGNISDIMDIR